VVDSASGETEVAGAVVEADGTVRVEDGHSGTIRSVLTGTRADGQ
jgi:hypothetical protein